MNLRQEQKELLSLTLESCNKQCEILDMLILTLNYRKGVVSIEKEKVELVCFLKSYFSDKSVEFCCGVDYISVYLDRKVLEKVLDGIISFMCGEFSGVKSFLKVYLNKTNRGFCLVFRGSVCEKLNEFKINSLDYKPIGILAQKELCFAMLSSLGFCIEEQVLEDKYSLTINYA